MSSLALFGPLARPLSSLLPATRPVSAPVGRQLVHLAGDASLLAHPCVAVVGSRQAPSWAIDLAAHLARQLAGAGFVVVSGLALGVDAAAHRGALAAGGRTVAVLGTGLDAAYPPPHASLQAGLARDHLVVTPFASGAPLRRGNFPRRNRLLAALTDATVVVSGGDSSGTRYQVAACLSPGLGRPVLLHRSLADPPLPWVRPLLGAPRVHLFASPAEVLALLSAGGAR